MAFTTYGKESGYADGTFIEGPARVTPSVAVAVPLGAQIAAAMHETRDTLADVDRLLDRIFGPEPEAKMYSNETTAPNGLLPQLADDACILRTVSRSLRSRINKIMKELGDG